MKLISIFLLSVIFLPSANGSNFNSSSSIPAPHQSDDLNRQKLLFLHEFRLECAQSVDFESDLTELATKIINIDDRSIRREQFFSIFPADSQTVQMNREDQVSDEVINEYLQRFIDMSVTRRSLSKALFDECNVEGVTSNPTSTLIKLKESLVGIVKLLKTFTSGIMKPMQAKARKYESLLDSFTHKIESSKVSSEYVQIVERNKNTMKIQQEYLQRFVISADEDTISSLTASINRIDQLFSMRTEEQRQQSFVPTWMLKKNTSKTGRKKKKKVTKRKNPQYTSKPSNTKKSMADPIASTEENDEKIEEETLRETKAVLNEIIKPEAKATPSVEKDFGEADARDVLEPDSLESLIFKSSHGQMTVEEYFARLNKFYRTQKETSKSNIQVSDAKKDTRPIAQLNSNCLQILIRIFELDTGLYWKDFETLIRSGLKGQIKPGSGANRTIIFKHPFCNNQIVRFTVHAPHPNPNLYKDLMERIIKCLGYYGLELTDFIGEKSKA